MHEFGKLGPCASARVVVWCCWSGIGWCFSSPEIVTVEAAAAVVVDVGMV